MIPDRITDGASGLLSVFMPLRDDSTCRLLFILCLPFVDGVFATLLVTGAVSTFSQVLNVALTIFSGAGALAVLFSESESRKHARKMVRSVVPPLVAGAVAVALVAPVFEQLFNLASLRMAAGLAVLGIAGQLAGIGIADRLSVPAVMLTGLVISFRSPSSLSFSLQYVYPAISTAVTAGGILYLASYLDPSRLDLSYVRKGGSAVLVVIAASVMGLNLPSEIGLGIFFASLAAGFQAR